MYDCQIWQLIGDVLKIASWILSFNLLAKKNTLVYVLTEFFSLGLTYILSLFFINEASAQKNLVLNGVLKDAQTGYVLAEMSGYDNQTMDRLALEDQQKDSYVAVIVREESGGSLGILAVLGLSLLSVYRRSRSVAKPFRSKC